MKSTGVIRKIDDLGRIVIPKEIRKVLNIFNGDDLEIYVEGEKIVLKKYSALLNTKAESDKLISKVDDLTEANIYITDKERIITRGELENKRLNARLKELLLDRRSYISRDKETYEFESITKTGFFIIKPIIQNSDANGLVIIFKQEKLTNEDYLFANILKKIIENE